jgi:small GTP-binding protein
MEAKVVLLGAASVGKTSIVMRVCSDEFDIEQPQTIGAQYQTKTIPTDRADIVLRIWDTAGQERFRSLAPMYYQGCRAAVVVFSVVDPPSLPEAERWIHELRNRLEAMPDLYLVGNKADLDGHDRIGVEDATAAADSLGAHYFETSAKSGQNVQELFAAIANNIDEKIPPEVPIVPITAAKPKPCRC